MHLSKIGLILKFINDIKVSQINYLIDMVIKKYNLTLRNFNVNISKLVLKAFSYNSIEEYEFETNNPNFSLYIDTNTNHVTHYLDNVSQNKDIQNNRIIYVPISYLTDETKEYLYSKYIVKHGFYSFDEYFLCYSYSMPCILLNIPIYFINNTQTHQQQEFPIPSPIPSPIPNPITIEQTFGSCDNDELFEIEPIIDFKNLYCKRKNKKLMIRPYNIELDYNTRPNDYKKKIWNVFNTQIKYNKYNKAWIFPLIYKKRLLDNGVIFI